jgi:mRNA-degrading endonuclease RelE of RelBE toxin-antitoxin system
MPGTNQYQLVYTVTAVADIKKLDGSVKKLIKSSVEQRLSTDPLGFGKPLRYSLNGHRRLRVGHYRVVYRINPDEKQVIILAIKHRKDIYQTLK